MRSYASRTLSSARVRASARVSNPPSSPERITPDPLHFPSQRIFNITPCIDCLARPRASGPRCRDCAKRRDATRHRKYDRQRRREWERRVRLGGDGERKNLSVRFLSELRAYTFTCRCCGVDLDYTAGPYADNKAQLDR